jgi:hypothetical protein
LNQEILRILGPLSSDATSLDPIGLKVSPATSTAFLASDLILNHNEAAITDEKGQMSNISPWVRLARLFFATPMMFKRTVFRLGIRSYGQSLEIQGCPRPLEEVHFDVSFEYLPAFLLTWVHSNIPLSAPIPNFISNVGANDSASRIVMHGERGSKSRRVKTIEFEINIGDLVWENNNQDKNLVFVCHTNNSTINRTELDLDNQSILKNNEATSMRIMFDSSGLIHYMEITIHNGPGKLNNSNLINISSIADATFDPSNTNCSPIDTLIAETDPLQFWPQSYPSALDQYSPFLDDILPQFSPHDTKLENPHELFDYL